MARRAGVRAFLSHVDPSPSGPARRHAHRILVVDDQALHRRKLSLAVRALGHEAESAEGGPQALLRLTDERFDLVLLDLLMPDVDGFEVMDFMRRDRRLRDVPVIVVSALGSEMDSVVRAVELGADDVLPKHFDAVLLEARLESSLERVRARAREADRLHHVRRLTDAAAGLEASGAALDASGLDDTCARDDAVGRLARVFVEMARQARVRDARLSLQIERLRAAGLAAATALTLGLSLPLAHVALGATGRPAGTATDAFAPPAEAIGIGLWLGAIVASLCLPAALWRGARPLGAPPPGAATRGRSALALAAATGSVAGVLPLLMLATALPPAALAALLPAEAAIAIVLHGSLERRAPSRAGVAAIVLGALAIASLALWPSGSSWHVDGRLATGLLAPAGWVLAARAARRAGRLPGADPGARGLLLAGAGGAIAVLVLLPLAIAGDAFVPLFGAGAERDIAQGAVTVLLGIVLAAGGALAASLALGGTTPSPDVHAGADARGRAHGATRGVASLGLGLAGVGWSVVVLDAPVAAGTWAAFALFALAALWRVLDPGRPGATGPGADRDHRPGRRVRRRARRPARAWARSAAGR